MNDRTFERYQKVREDILRTFDLEELDEVRRFLAEDIAEAIEEQRENQRQELRYHGGISCHVESAVDDYGDDRYLTGGEE